MKDRQYNWSIILEIRHFVAIRQIRHFVAIRQIRHFVAIRQIRHFVALAETHLSKFDILSFGIFPFGFDKITFYPLWWSKITKLNAEFVHHCFRYTLKVNITH
jgi:hypothetical protein